MFIPSLPSEPPSSTAATAITPSLAADSNITSIATATRHFFARVPAEPLSTGSIVGISIGVFLFLVLCVFLAFLLRRHLRARAAFRAEQLRIQKEKEARQAVIDERIRKEKLREQVFRNAKIIQADARERWEDSKWDRQRAKSERERREREAKDAAAAGKEAAQPASDAPPTNA